MTIGLTIMSVGRPSLENHWLSPSTLATHGQFGTADYIQRLCADSWPDIVRRIPYFLSLQLVRMVPARSARPYCRPIQAQGRIQPDQPIERCRGAGIPYANRPHRENDRYLPGVDPLRMLLR
jgi:hypothetical protein